MARKRYAIVGTGGRSHMYYEALVRDEAISKHNELVALCDENPARMDYVNRVLETALPTYRPHEFGTMLGQEKLDGLVVTTRDCHHDTYIVKGLEAGLRVVTEKPMVTDEEKCRAVLAAMAGREEQLVVTFNYRYAPHNTKIKEVLDSGAIGEVTLVEFHWFLDTSHGADYYRRWHRQKHNSGSLLVHKATHHFDLVNWWTGETPEVVFALASKRFYRPETFPARVRCLDCDAKETCNFHINLKDGKKAQARYLEAEHEDGYLRDRCVFSPDIDIWDTRAATVGYAGGLMLSYSLNNYAPYEGYKVSFVGTKGRFEADVRESTYLNDMGEEAVRTKPEQGIALRVFPLFAASYDVPIEIAAGGHGGGDKRLLEDVFGVTDPAKDPFRRQAGGLDGAKSVLTGVAARRSIEWSRPVCIEELAPLPEA